MPNIKNLNLEGLMFTVNRTVQDEVLPVMPCSANIRLVTSHTSSIELKRMGCRIRHAK